MSCKDCNDFQDSGNKVYYRWKNANVGIDGCREHVLEIFEVLNKAQPPLKDVTRAEIDELILSFVVNNEPSHVISSMIKTLKVIRLSVPEDKI